MRHPARGEIWRVQLDPVIGHEQGRMRPAVVVSTDALNQGPSGLVTVIPITGTRRNIPLHIHVQRGVGGLTKDSWILCDQIRTISKARLHGPLGRVSPAVLTMIADHLKLVLELD